ncbi:alpha/beta fold hydrolase [Halorientalis salina]|uniref:alpha/beta fold hydrolase n=1 Tax=Halorientalis salina TaxID=2932266 RepID=UPI00145CE42C|nr:alpha/beta hydrolase [Halorientalis salina]
MARSDQFITVDDFELHYSAWGDPENPPVLCVHGLSRVGRDFDPLAAALEDDYHVVCPDMPGRGLSQWAEEPSERYTNGAMVEVLVGLCDQLGFDSLGYVGTSMGAGLGMALAAGPLADRITHLVVNDMPPNPETDSSPEALGRIMEYVPDPPTFDRVTELEAYYRDLYQGRFGAMSDDEWRRLTVTSARRTSDGAVAPAYDPDILVEDEDDEDGPDPWAVWERIESEILILRGQNSEILPQEPYERMQEVQPGAETLEVDCGHAPSLNTDDQIETIQELLAL